METTEGFAAIRKLNFPHASKYHERRIGRIIDEKNLDICIILKCRQLDTIGLAFNWRQLVKDVFTKEPRELDAFLDRFHFRSMLEHEVVKNMYLEGCLPEGGRGKDVRAFGRVCEVVG